MQHFQMIYSGIPIFRTSKGNKNWFEKTESLQIGDKIVVFDCGGETTFGLSYREVRKMRVRFHCTKECPTRHMYFHVICMSL